MKKLLVVMGMITIIVMVNVLPVSAKTDLYGFWASYVTTTVCECHNGSTATNLVLGAEGCRGSKSVGAKTKKYARCANDQKKTCSYFNVKSTYGYCIAGCNTTDNGGKYIHYKGYVH